MLGYHATPAAGSGERHTTHADTVSDGLLCVPLQLYAYHALTKDAKAAQDGAAAHSSSPASKQGSSNARGLRRTGSFMLRGRAGLHSLLPGSGLREPVQLDPPLLHPRVMTHGHAFSGELWTIPAMLWSRDRRLERFPPITEGPAAVAHKWHAVLLLQEGILQLKPVAEVTTALGLAAQVGKIGSCWQ